MTDHIVETLSRKREGQVCLLLGSYAQAKGKLIDTRRHCVLKAPSPLDAYRDFIGCGPLARGLPAGADRMGVAAANPNQAVRSSHLFALNHGGMPALSLLTNIGTIMPLGGAQHLRRNEALVSVAPRR